MAAKNQSVDQVEKKGWPIRPVGIWTAAPRDICALEEKIRTEEPREPLHYPIVRPGQTMADSWQILTRNHICFRTFDNNLALFEIWQSDIASAIYLNSAAWKQYFLGYSYHVNPL